MSLDVFQAYIQGYSDRLFDQQIMSVQSGYWAAYFTNSKHPKPVKTIISEMSIKKDKVDKSHSKNVVKPEVDVEAFLETEAKFLKQLQAK